MTYRTSVANYAADKTTSSGISRCRFVGNDRQATTADAVHPAARWAGTVPRKMDIEAKYEAGEVRPLDQRNEMHKRMDRDKKLEGMWRGFSGVIPADGSTGLPDALLSGPPC